MLNMINFSCLKCNLCSTKCPIFKFFPVEINSPRFLVKANKIDICLLCGMCETVCPPKLSIREIIKKKIKINKKINIYPIVPESNTLVFAGCIFNNMDNKIKKHVYNWIEKNNFQIDEKNCCGYFLPSDDSKILKLKKYFLKFKKIIFLCPHGFSFWKQELHNIEYYIKYISNIPKNTFFSCTAQLIGYKNNHKINCCGSGGIMLKTTNKKELIKINKNFNKNLKKLYYFDCPYCYNSYTSKKKELLWVLLKQTQKKAN